MTAAPSLNPNSREAGELQDMYRRTLAAYWSAQPGELKADECIEDIFAGGDGWGDREKPYAHQQQTGIGLRYLNGDSSGSPSESESRHTRASSNSRKSHETLRPGDMKSSRSSVRGRGSLEQQASHMQAEAKRHRHGIPHEVDEVALREDLCSWRRPI